jgi:hypothetical protein
LRMKKTYQRPTLVLRDSLVKLAASLGVIISDRRVGDQ